MLNKAAHHTRQSPLQKFAEYGENTFKVVGAIQGAWHAGQQIMKAGQAAYSVAQSVAPYAAALL